MTAHSKTALEAAVSGHSISISIAQCGVSDVCIKYFALKKISKVSST